MVPHWQTHPGRGEPLLLVHGFLSSSAQWQPNLEAMAEACRPVTVDLWGHGDSPAPDGPEAYAPDAYVAAFDEIRRELGVERWWLAGYSLGASLTLRYALAHPDRVRGQVFTNSTSAFADERQRAAWRDGAERSAEAILAGGRDTIERMPIHPRRATRLPADVHAALCRDAARLDPRGVASTIRYTNPVASVRDRIGDNQVPALLVCGARENRFRPHRAFAAAHMPDLTIVDVDAGHAVSMEAADAFNAAVVDFLRMSL